MKRRGGKTTWPRPKGQRVSTPTTALRPHAQLPTRTAPVGSRNTRWRGPCVRPSPSIHAHLCAELRQRPVQSSRVWWRLVWYRHSLAGRDTRSLLVLQKLTNTQNRKKRPFDTPQRSRSPACGRGRMLESLSSQHIWALRFSTDWPGVKVYVEWICCGFGFSLASRYDSWPLHSLPAFCFLTRMREGSLQGETTPPSLAGMPNVHVCLSLT